MKCALCSRRMENGVIITVPKIRESVQYGEREIVLEGLIQITVCDACTGTERSVAGINQDGNVLTALPRYRMFIRMSHEYSTFCYRCGENAQLSQASIMRQGNVLSWLTPAGLIRRSSFISTFTFRRCFDYIKRSPQYYLPRGVVRIGKVTCWVPDADDGVTFRHASCFARASQLASDAFLCDGCHAEIGRLKCPSCGLWTEDKARMKEWDMCGACAAFSGRTKSENLDELRCQECRRASVSDPVMNGSGINSHSYMMFFMGDERLKNCQPCSCPDVPKKFGECVICALIKDYPDGIQGFCADCAEHYTGTPLGVDLTEPTFGSELELICDDADCGGDCDDDILEDDGDGDYSNGCRATNASSLFRRVFGGGNEALLSVGEDCSLSAGGVEIRVGPLNEKHLPQFLRYLALLSDTHHTDGSCGGHVHFGVQCLKWFTIKDLARYAWKYQEEFHALVPERRRENTYCHALAAQHGLIANAKTEPEFLQACLSRFDKRFLSTSKRPNEHLNLSGRYENHMVGCTHSRYSWFNISPVWVRRTFEIRLLEGTTSAPRLGGWIKGWLHLINGLRNESEQAREDFIKNTSPIKLFTSLGLRVRR